VTPSSAPRTSRCARCTWCCRQRRHAAGSIYCAGTPVARRGADAASCVEENLTANTVEDIEVRCGTNVDELFAVTEIKLNRYYTRETGSVDDLALVRLDGASTAPVAELNERALTAADTGPSDPAACAEGLGGITVAGCAALIGFGETLNGADDPGDRVGTNVPVRAVDAHSLQAGTLTQTTCKGDTGAAVFMDLGDGPVLVAVSTSNKLNCNSNIVRTRSILLDRYRLRLPGSLRRLAGSTTSARPAAAAPTPTATRAPGTGTCGACPTRDADCPIRRVRRRQRGRGVRARGHCLEATTPALLQRAPRPRRHRWLPGRHGLRRRRQR
jgi:hypothetical protein